MLPKHSQIDTRIGIILRIFQLRNGNCKQQNRGKTPEFAWNKKKCAVRWPKITFIQMAGAWLLISYSKIFSICALELSGNALHRKHTHRWGMDRIENFSTDILWLN